MKLKKLVAFLLLACMIISATACGGGGTIIQEVDKSKTQIYIRMYNGGTGVKWIKDMKDVWNSKNSEYEIIIYDDAKPSADSMMGEARSEYSEGGAHVWFSATPGFRPGVESGVFADLSDILTMKAEGDTKTIGEKLTTTSFYNDWKNIATLNGNGLYMLPYTDAMIGFVYDHADFVAHNWLSYANTSELSKVTADGVKCEISGEHLVVTEKGRYYAVGDKVLTAGKDGKYGTYDDGQPITEQEWSNLILKIRNTSGYKTFIWNGSGSDYHYHTAMGILAQYGGLDDFNTYFTYDSKGEKMKMHNGDEIEINIDNGYKVYESEALYQAYKFIGNYLVPIENQHPVCYAEATHQSSKANYLYGCREVESNPQGGFLLEGTWWENEAAHGEYDIFQSNVDAGYPDRGYGLVDYRFMLPPAIAGQAGIDGNGNGTALSVCSTGAVVVRAMKDEKMLSAIKDFLVYTMSDANLAKFTMETGEIRPFDYSLSDAQMSQLTPFSRAHWDLYRDAENIAFVRPWLKACSEPMNYATTNGTYLQTFTPTKGKTGMVGNMVIAIQNNALGYEGAFNSFYYDSTTWGKFVKEARDNGYYKNK